MRSKLLWENMQLVEPWQNEEVGDEVFTMNPTFLPRDRLSTAQQAVTCPFPALISNDRLAAIPACLHAALLCFLMDMQY